MQAVLDDLTIEEYTEDTLEDIKMDTKSIIELLKQILDRNIRTESKVSALMEYNGIPARITTMRKAA